MNSFFQIFTYPFAIRAIIAGTLVSLCAALLGVNLVLKRFSMLGDGLSHVSFGAAAIALAAGVAPLKISVPIVVVAAFLLIRLNENSKLRGDAAIALVSSSSLAIGVTVATLTTGMNTDINNYMFGSILALSKNEVYISVAAAIVIITVYLICYQKIFAVSFDERFASATGVHTEFYTSLSAVLTAVIVVIGMRIMGALLISSIITFPMLSSMRVCKRYRSTVIVTSVISVFSFLCGIFLSFFYDMPAGASVVLVNLAVFMFMSFIEKIKSI